MTKLNVEHFIQAQKYGVLSTHSVSEPGYPFGSITPYIVTEQGDLAIFISHLAEHTKNINTNTKVSLTIFDPTDAINPSAGARITCLADAEIEHNDNELRKRYKIQHPESAPILDLGGFHFYLLKLTKIRLVSGFGQVKWLSKEEVHLS